MKEILRVVLSGLIAAVILAGINIWRDLPEGKTLAYEKPKSVSASTADIVRSVETLEDLTERRGVVVGETFLVRERMAGHGGGGTWDAIDGRNQRANGFDIVASRGTAGMNFALRGNEPLSAKQWGAVGDGVTDDSAAIQHLVNQKKEIYFEAGRYVCHNIRWPLCEGMTLRGAGANVVEFLNNDTTGKNCFNLIGEQSAVGYRVAHVRMSGFTITGNPKSGHGIYTDLSYENQFEGICLRFNGGESQDGLHIRRGFYSEIRRVTCQSNGRDGVHLGETANGNVVFGGHFGGGEGNANGRAGVFIGSDGGADRTHGCQVIGGVFESNRQYNILIDDGDENLILGNYIESDPAHHTIAQVAVTSTSNATSLHNVIQDNDFTGGPESIRISRARGTLVIGNGINYGMTIEESAEKTRVMANPQFEGAFTDNGSGTILHQDQDQTDRWYSKHQTYKAMSLLAAGGSSVIDSGPTNYLDIKGPSGLHSRFEADGLLRSISVGAHGDSGGMDGVISLTNQQNTGSPRNGGNGAIKFAAGGDQENAGFIAIRIGKRMYYVPVFESN